MKIWEHKENKIEPVLKLQQDSDGYVHVIAVDENGCNISHGKLLVITPNGFLYVSKDVNQSLDFIFDNCGRIKIDEGYDRAPVERAGLHRVPIFRLVKKDNIVYLSLVDEDGYQILRGQILSFENKEITIIGEVNHSYGLQLDKDGMIVTR